MKQSTYLNESIAYFRNQTLENRANWRILRPNTVIDLILLELHKFIHFPNKDSLLKIVHYTIILDYNIANGTADVEEFYKGNITENQIADILADSEKLFLSHIHQNDKLPVINLFSEYQYLNQLKNYNYTFVIIETLLGIICEAINKLNN